MITLNYAGSTLQLHPDMLWADEFGWSPVAQKTERTITGSLLIDTAAMSAGRPITLLAGESYAWTTRQDLATLKSWEAIPGAQLVLTIRGGTFNVLFDHDRKGVEGQPIADFSDPLPTDWCSVALRFIEV